MRSRNHGMRGSRGQSLVETALMVPLLLIVIMNALNVGYFFFVTVNLTAAVRSGLEYSMMGPGAPGTTNYPPAATGLNPVATLIYNDMTGAVQNATSATVQICSPSVLIGTPPTGTSGTPPLANCLICTSLSNCNSGGSASTGALATFVPDADPNTAVVLNRVDVQYTFDPLIPGGLFNLMTIAGAYNSGTKKYTFYRHAEMRAN